MNFERKAFDGNNKRLEENGSNKNKTLGSAFVSRAVAHKKRKVSKHAPGGQGVVSEEMSSSRKAGIKFRARRKQIEGDLRKKLDECYKENVTLNRSNKQLSSEKESLLEDRARLLKLISQFGIGEPSGLAQDNKVAEQNAPQLSVVHADSTSSPLSTSPVTAAALTITSEKSLETTNKPLLPLMINPTTKTIGADVVNAVHPTTLIPTFQRIETLSPFAAYGDPMPTQPVLYQWPVAEAWTERQEKWSCPQRDSPFDEL